MAAAADFVSPFASSFAQHASSGSPLQPDSPLPQPSHTSRSGSPLRVVGFHSSPNSVVAPRRWQSAALPGSTEAQEAAAAMDAAIAAAAGGSSSGASGACLTPQQRPSLASLERKGSLGTLLRQQDQLNSMQRRLTAINTARPLTLRKSPCPEWLSHLGPGSAWPRCI
ncbi:hypothetical protein COHA_001113 [Chlorella ohadii]|uniref:Uncharacterized protein n=1 Tax=Chlorella ohadii TaxID=2649997 RepID=A0AAD5DZ67_9CHLO|nr:hypothetical protein COHA_001113 [Chlorella ohadii]